MQLRDLERLLGEIDAGHPRAARGHALGEYAAAAADVEHAACRSSPAMPVDVVEPQRIDLVQRLELGCADPTSGAPAG